MYGEQGIEQNRNAGKKDYKRLTLLARKDRSENEGTKTNDDSQKDEVPVLAARLHTPDQGKHWDHRACDDGCDVALCGCLRCQLSHSLARELSIKFASSRLRHPKVFANLSRQVVVYFGMPGNCAALIQ